MDKFLLPPRFRFLFIADITFIFIQCGRICSTNIYFCSGFDIRWRNHYLEISAERDNQAGSPLYHQDTSERGQRLPDSKAAQSNHFLLFILGTRHRPVGHLGWNSRDTVPSCNVEVLYSKAYVAVLLRVKRSRGSTLGDVEASLEDC